MNQIELNKKLYDECLKETINPKVIEDLLVKGANPLGTISVKDKYKYVYNEIMFENNNLYTLTQLFIKHGMKINYKDYEEDSDNNINPLWCLALVTDFNGISTLKLLLENGLEYESAEVLVDHIYTDFIFLDEAHDFDEKYEKEAFQAFEIAMKMILLCSSYSNVLKKSEYIKEIICLDFNNKENLSKLKEYNSYYMKEEYNKILYFYEKTTNKLIWKLDYKNDSEC